MLSREVIRAMQQEARFFGLEQGFKQFSIYPFGGMNQMSTSRLDGKDNESWWQENLIKTGDGCLRTLWDKGTALYTAQNGKTIVYFFSYNIGSTNYFAVFLSDGTAIQVNASSGATTTISSAAGEFYRGGQLPACSQWGAEYLIIANNFSANNYWIWDAINLYGAGTLGPLVTITSSGARYFGPPPVTAFGGNGTGATFVASISAGAVTNIQITNPGTGYQPGDVVQLFFDSTNGGDQSPQLTAVLTATTVQSVIISDAGFGYTPGTYALSFSGGGGTGAAGTYTVGAGGTVTSTSISNAGSGYTSQITVSFPSGGGTGASGYVLYNSTTVASVTVVHGGTGFGTAPLLTFSGGGGSGATGTANLTGQAISSVTVNSAGSGYTSPPAVIAQSGINAAAAATVTLMPYGVSGSSIETFQSRVWLPFPNQSSSFPVTGSHNGDVFIVSAPGSLTNFATSSGGVVFASTDSFLRQQYVNIKQSNGYLYPFGDSSVSVISNVQTTGSPSTTTFNYQNTDPQTGAAWRDAVQSYSRTILFANALGVFGLYGGAVTKISKNMDNIFNNAVFPAAGGVTPTSAVANIYNLKVYLINLTVTDPFTDATRTLMLGWDEKEWFIASQSIPLTFIGTQEINSNLMAWGTDGNSLFQLMATPSASLTKKLSSKLYGESNFLVQKQAMGVYAQVQDLSVGATGISFGSFTIDTEHGSYNVPQLPAFASGAPPYYPINSFGSGDVVGVNLGFTLTLNASDATLNYMSIGHLDVSSIAMSSTALTGQINTE